MFNSSKEFINEDVFDQKDPLKKLENNIDSIITDAKSKEDSFSKTSFSLIHYDLSPGNIIKSDGNIIFLDWRQASIGDRAMDVAKLFYKQGLDEKQKRLFLDVYKNNLKDEKLEERVNTYYPLVIIGSLLWRLRFINIDSKENPELLKRANINLIKERLQKDYDFINSYNN